MIRLCNSILAATAALAITAACQTVQAAPGYAHEGPMLISGVPIINGLGNEPVADRDILMVDGRISAIGVVGSLDAPEGALAIDGAGLTAMPGLMDLHIHTQGGWANGVIPGEQYAPSHEDKDVQQRLSGYVYAGVTTVLDTGADHDWVVHTRNRINAGDLFGPRHFTTGVAWSSAPSGWDAGNTSGGDWAKSTIVGDLSDLPGQVARYKADGIDILKACAGIGMVGLQALVEGNPAENIDDTRNVREVFMEGRQVDRASLMLGAE